MYCVTQCLSISMQQLSPRALRLCLEVSVPDTNLQLLCRPCRGHMRGSVEVAN